MGVRPLSALIFMTSEALCCSAALGFAVSQVAELACGRETFSSRPTKAVLLNLLAGCLIFPVWML